MADTYKVHFINEEHDIDQVIECADDITLLEGAEAVELNLPYSCRAGACSSCAGVLLEGEVNQEDQSFLDDDHLEKGAILTCVAYATSDCKITPHAEEELF